MAAVDDWACALVPTASSVSLLFYGLLFQDPRFVVEACVHGTRVAAGLCDLPPHSTPTDMCPLASCDARRALRPAWLSPVMHGWNSLAAWGDALLCRQRTFSGRAGRLALGLVVAYTLWIQVVFHMHGQYPYPVLNQLPHPHGFLLLSFIGYAIALSVFLLARLLARHVLARPVRDEGVGASSVRANGGARRARAKAA